MTKEEAISILTYEANFLYKDDYPYSRQAYDMAIEALGNERGKGHWIWSLADNGWADHTCSECGYTKNTDIHVRLDWDFVRVVELI